MYISVNIWFLCFVIAAVCCCIHVCSVTGEVSQRKRRRRAKTTELKQLFSKNYLISPGGFKVQPWISPFYTPHRPSGHVIAFYVQRARLRELKHGTKTEREHSKLCSHARNTHNMQIVMPLLGSSYVSYHPID